MKPQYNRTVEVKMNACRSSIQIQQEARASTSLQHLTRNLRTTRPRLQDLREVPGLHLQDLRLRDPHQKKAPQAIRPVKNLLNQMPPNSKLEEMNSSESVFYMG